MSSKDSSLGLQIKQEREARGISQEDLAKMCHMTLNRIIDYETGKVRPNGKSLMTIVNVFEEYYKHSNFDPSKTLIDDSKVHRRKSNRKSNNNSNIYYDGSEGPSFEPKIYDRCYADLIDSCFKLKDRLIQHNKVDQECLNIINNKIYNCCSSLEHQFKRSIAISAGLDKYLSVYTIKNCLGQLIDCYNYLYTIDCLIMSVRNNDSTDKILLGNFMFLLKSSIHSLRFAVNYLNDFFNMEFDNVLLITKPNGTLYSLFEVGMLSQMMKEKEEKEKAV